MAEENKNEEELFRQMDHHLLHDERPSEYLGQISREPWFLDYPFSMLGKMKETPQSKRFHPEGSVWNHTMMVVDQAAEQKAKSKDARTLMWAALLHDIGKPAVTKIRKEKITAYNHDAEGEHLTEDFLSCFSTDAKWIREVAKLVRYHMHILYVTDGLPFGDVDGMKRETDIGEIALLGLCDRIGRGGSVPEDEAKAVRLFLKKMRYK